MTGYLYRKCIISYRNLALHYYVTICSFHVLCFTLLTDDYFFYESDELPSLHPEPVIKLLNKREAMDISDSTKKPTSMKPQLNSSPENSTNSKLVNVASGVADMQQGNSKPYLFIL